MTEEPRYLALTNYFVEQRGGNRTITTRNMKSAGRPRTGTLRPGVDGERQSLQPGTFAHRQQQTAIGHAVRFVYLMTGVGISRV